MSSKNANLKVLLEDLKISFRFALQNLISFVLGMIGVLIVTGFLIAIVAAFIIVPIVLTGGINVLIEIIVAWVNTTQALPGATALFVIFLFLTPVMAPMMVAIGALYGMGREIVESEGTSAEGVLSWYSKKFFSLAGVGMIQFILIIVPLAAATVLLGPFSFGLEQAGLASVVIAIYAIYMAFMSGLTSLAFPAVIDGNSAISSIRISVRLSLRYFDRVFSTWLAYIGIALAIASPMILSPLIAPLGSGQIGLALGFLGPYALIATLFLVFVLLPALVIGMSRIYMILVSDNLTDAASQEFFDDMPIVGGE